MKSWKTTAGGVMLALGAPLAAAGEGWVAALGAALLSLGGLLTGLAARDNDVTSEEAHADEAARKRSAANGRMTNLCLAALLIPAALLPGCQLLGQAPQIIQVTEDWTAAGVAGSQAWDAYQSQRDVAPYPGETVDREVLARLAFREGLFAFGFGLAGARDAAPDGEYTDWLGEAVNAAVWWTRARYPALTEDWVDLLLRYQGQIERLTGNLPPDLARAVNGLLAWLDALEPGPLPAAKSAAIAAATE